VTAPYDADLIKLIDQRIRLSAITTRSMGTIVTRDTTGPGATALFDGSTNPVPVKVFGSAMCQPGGRVAIEKFGSDWIVIGAYSTAQLGQASRNIQGLSGTTGNLTSSTYVDLSEFGTFVFQKLYDSTYIECGLACGAFADANGSVVEFGVRLTATAGGVGYTTVDKVIGMIPINGTNVHETDHLTQQLTGHPAGTYTVTLRWRRKSGTANIAGNATDFFGMTLYERVPFSSPYL
jgi:hypothetical protein